MATRRGTLNLVLSVVRLFDQSRHKRKPRSR